MTLGLHDIPGNCVEFAAVPSHAALTATELVNLWRAPYAARVVSVEVIPDAAASGTDDDSANYNLLNAGTDGAGTTELDNVDFASGTDMAAGVAISLYAPATPLSVAAGTILQLQIQTLAGGLLLPRAMAVITYRAV